MSGTAVDTSESGRPVETQSASPGVYRPPAAAPTAAGQAGPSGDKQSDTGAAQATSAAAPQAVDARRRFHQLRLLRRELAERPLPGDINSGASLSTTAAHPLQLHSTAFPTSAAYGLALNRLPSSDPATRHILRTAAAERALHHQQAENDELKRLVVSQRLEAEDLKSQLERLSGELAASGQTVLRQTATMRALTSEMERHDAYHLIKQRRESDADALQRRIEALEAELVRLNAEKAALQDQVAESAQRRRAAQPVEAIERDDEESVESGKGGTTPIEEHNNSSSFGWIACAAEELQRLSLAFGRIVRGPTSTSYTAATSFSGAANVVFEVELSELSFSAASLQQKISTADRDGCVPRGMVSVCGPYNTHHLLLRLCLSAVLPPLSAPPPSMWRHTHAEERWHVSRFYALPDTDGVLSLRLHAAAAGEGGEGNREAEKRGGSGRGDCPCSQSPSPAASLWSAAAAPDRYAGQRRARTSTVHTVHLHRAGDAVSRGAATFTATVSAVLPTLPQSRGAFDRRSPQRAESVQESLPYTPRASVDAAPTRRADGGAVHTQHRTPLLSPSRDVSNDVATPSPSVSSSAPLETVKPTLPAVEAQSLPTATGVRTAKADDATNAPGDDVCLDWPGQPAKVNRDRSPSPPLPPPPPPPPAAFVPPPPPSNVAVPLPPIVSVPAPPVVAVPQPPPSSSPASSASAPSEEPSVGVRITVQAIANLRSGTSLDDVEEMLECSSAQVGVYRDDGLLFTAPPRRVVSRAQWSAEDGGCSTTLTSAQTLRFEVRRRVDGGVGAGNSAGGGFDEQLGRTSADADGGGGRW